MIQTDYGHLQPNIHGILSMFNAIQKHISISQYDAISNIIPLQKNNQ
jgi:hypothetical protein